MKHCVLILCAVLQVVPYATRTRARDAVESILGLESTYADVHSFTTLLRKWERIDDALVFQLVQVRYRDPGDVFIEVLDGTDAGLKAVYRSGQNGDRVTVRTSSRAKNLFGRLLGRLSVDPRSAEAMMNQHHPITTMNLSNLVAVILRDVRKALARGEDSIVFVEPDVLHGRETLIVSITSPALDGESHRVSQGETLWDIAEDRGQDMYVMRHHNRDVLDPNKVRAGHMVFVPHYYAFRTFVWLSPATGLIQQVQIYDWNNELYEMFIFENLRINIELGDDAFDVG